MGSETVTINNYLTKLNAAFRVEAASGTHVYKIKETDNTEHFISYNAYKELYNEAEQHYKEDKVEKETSGDAKMKELLNAAKGSLPDDDNGQDGKD